MDYTWLQLYQMVTTLLLLWQLHVSMQQDMPSLVTQTSSACFYEPEKALTLNCSQGHMVRLDDIYYGYTTTDRCEYEPGDCNMPMPNYEMYPCIGRGLCQINLPTGDKGRYMPKCEEYGTYIQADYACVPEAEVHDICNSDQPIKGQSGYISTPRYPNNYPDNMDCRATIEAPHYNQNIRLYIIDLTLEDRSTDCADTLHIFDGHRAATLCGTRARMTAFTSIGNSLELQFISNGEEQRKGFWLMYQAEPFIETTTAPSTTPTTTVTTTTTKPEDHTTSPTQSPTEIKAVPPDPQTTNQTDVQGTIIIYQKVPISTEAIIGITVCLLLLLTVIILVVLVFRRKESNATKLPSAVSCNSQSAFLETANNSQITHMDFTNSEVFLKMCDEKGPNNIETAAAVASTSNALYGDGEPSHAVYGHSMVLPSPNIHGNTLTATRNSPRVNMEYSNYEYEC